MDSTRALPIPELAPVITAAPYCCSFCLSEFIINKIFKISPANNNRKGINEQ